MLNILDHFRILAEEVKKIVLQRMEGPAGVNERTGTNTLVNSNLYNSVTTTYTDNSIAFEIADYFEYIVRGRKSGWKGRPHKDGTKGIVASIMEWVERKNIKYENKTYTQTAWAILNALEVRDITARPFINYDKDGDLTKMLPELNAYMDEWFNGLFNIITEKIDKFFNG